MKRRWPACRATLLFLLMLHPVAAISAVSSWMITGHRMDVRFDPSAHTVFCADTITLRLAGKPEGACILPFPSLYRIASLSVNSSAVRFVHEAYTLTIPEMPGDSIAVLAVRYDGTWPGRSEFSSVGTDMVVMREEDLLPCGPRLLQSVIIDCEVPAGWETCTVGRMTGSSALPDGFVRHRWVSNQLLREIGWICAGPWNHAGINASGVPVTVRTLPADSAYGSSLLPLLSDLIGWYGSISVPYRFPKLDVIEIADWVAGGTVLAIAGPSFIMVKQKAFLREDRYNTAESILPHETAHQWWPLTVFVGDSDAAFLSEGMCEYASNRYHHARGISSARDTLATHPLLRPLLLRARSQQDLPLRRSGDLRSVPSQYLKAAYVHHMLLQLIGESSYDSLISRYTRLCEGSDGSLTIFRRLAESVSGMNLGWFFRQWVEQPGIPAFRLYHVKSARNRETAGWLTGGHIRLVGYEKYSSDVRIVVNAVDGEKAEILVRVGEDSSGKFRNDVTFGIASAGRPLSVSIDPGGNLLRMRPVAPRFSNLREPSDGVMIVGSGRGSAGLLEEARSDSSLLSAGGWNIRLKADTAATLGDLQNGAVFLYGSAVSNSLLELHAVKFPMRASGDTVRTSGETITDSTIGLLQVIDNPFRAGGIWCWIAPMSEHSGPKLLPYDASWVIVRGRDVVTSGVWAVPDPDGEVIPDER